MLGPSVEDIMKILKEENATDNQKFAKTDKLLENASENERYNLLRFRNEAQERIDVR